MCLLKIHVLKNERFCLEFVCLQGICVLTNKTYFLRVNMFLEDKRFCQNKCVYSQSARLFSINIFILKKKIALNKHDYSREDI